MKKIKLIIWILLLSTFCTAQTFTSKDNTFSYSVDIDKPYNLQIELVTQNKVCNTQLELSDEHKQSILKTEFMMNKQKAMFNASLSKGKYTLVYKTLSNCGNVDFDISLRKISGDFEQEPNDTLSSATKIDKQKHYTGYLQKYKDIDYYSFKVENRANISLIFEHQIVNTFGAYVVELYDASSKKIASFNSSAKSEKDTKNITLEKGTYTIKIYGDQLSSGHLRHYPYKLGYSVSK